MFSPDAVISLPSWPSISLAELNTATRRTRSPDSTLSSSRSTCSGESWMPGLLQRLVHLALGLGDLVAVELDALLGVVDVLAEAVDRVGERGPAACRPWARSAASRAACTMRSSSSRMFLRRPSIFFCSSTMGTSVTTPSAASSRSRTLRSRSSRVSVQIGLHDEVALGGQLARLAAVLGGVLQDGVDRLHQALGLLGTGFRVGRGGGWRCLRRPPPGSSSLVARPARPARRRPARLKRSPMPSRLPVLLTTTSAIAAAPAARTACDANGEQDHTPRLPVWRKVEVEIRAFLRAAQVLRSNTIVGGFEQAEQIVVDLPGVGENDHVRDGRAGAVQLRLLQVRVEGRARRDRVRAAARWRAA